MMQKINFRVLVLLCGLILGLMPLAAQDSRMPLEEGMYQVGVQILDLVDEDRNGREVETFVWYPALVSDDAPRPYPVNTSGAPYPLIIFSHGAGGVPIDGMDLFISRLVSHGFVVAAPSHEDPPDIWKNNVERPLDILFVLNQLAELEGSELADIIDTQKVGVTGFSFGGYTTLAAGGARIHPDYFLDWCTNESNAELTFYCDMASIWDEFSAYREQYIPPSGDDLWAATTDERIVAILPMIPCLGQLFGEEGLEAVTVPTLIIAGTQDPQCILEIEGDFMYEHVGSADKYMVRVDVPGHGQALQEDVVRHYTTAFFGYYLQGIDEYTEYLAPDSAELFEHVTVETQLVE